MHSFNEKALISNLEALPAQAQAAFAAASATRQLANYERFAQNLGIEKSNLANILAKLWPNILDNIFDKNWLSLKLDELMNLLPEEGEDESIWYALADDAISSLGYTIRYILKPDAQEAAWAARRAYEAADQIAIRVLDARPGIPQSEIKIRSHFIVQRELMRQLNDLKFLREESIEKVRQQAYAEKLITIEEIGSLNFS